KRPTSQKPSQAVAAEASSNRKPPLIRVPPPQNPPLSIKKTRPFNVSSADLAEEILKTHDPICSNRPESSVARGIYDCKDIAFSTYGEYWRRVKGICVNHLLRIQKVQSFRNVREEEVSVMLEKIRQFV
ncbi:hypothetical protein MIMGU_mgv11b016203mg, partial [Erythranthe guttata]